MGTVVHNCSESIPISRIAGHYLLFDIDVVTYLRREHNICGVLIGGIPQVPQQNVFLGLPVEIFPEEAFLLVEKDVAHIIDDATWHQSTFSYFQVEGKGRYLEASRVAGRQAQKSAAKGAQKRAERGLAMQAIRGASKSRSRDEAKTLEDQGDNLFFDNHDSGRLRSPSQASIVSTSASMTASTLTVTSTTTYSLSLPQNSCPQDIPSVPLSYPLYAHLHARKYFLTPGLRFGCDYTVYPGDPLRFHSHFLAVGYDWSEEIPLIDLIGGGRLGTGVKKGFLIGGKDPAMQVVESGDDVRTFCIEWGGM